MNMNMNTVLHTDTYMAQHGYNCPVSLSLPLSANEHLSHCFRSPSVSSPLSLSLCISPSVSSVSSSSLYFLCLFSIPYQCLCLSHSVPSPMFLSLKISSGLYHLLSLPFRVSAPSLSLGPFDSVSPSASSQLHVSYSYFTPLSICTLSLPLVSPSLSHSHISLYSFLPLYIILPTKT
jgi:hypothetical protein